MEAAIRPARVDDHHALESFTHDTFEWGDYVADSFDAWLTDPAGRVYVAVDDRDRAIAVGRCALLSPREAWMSGARVHPDHRREGIASRIGAVLADWASEQGAAVVRLLIEDWNTAARAQVEAIGFRHVLAAFHGRRAFDEAPRLSGNGGRKTGDFAVLNASPPGEAEPAYLSWAAGPLARASRSMFGIGWSWRRLILTDLQAAARHGALWSSVSGTVMAAIDDDLFEVAWCDTTADDVFGLAASVIDLARREGAGRVRVALPSVDWLMAGFRDAGFQTEGIGIYALALPTNPASTAADQ